MKIIKIGSGKHKVAIISGIHGEEKSGPLAIIEFQKKLLGKYITSCSFLLIPVFNSESQQKNIREFRGLDLNTAFGASMPVEFQPLQQALLDFQPDLFLDLHEDSVTDYHYIWANIAADQAFYQAMIKGTPEVQLATWEDGDPEWGGKTAEEFIRSSGCEYTVTTETYPNFPLSERIQLQLTFIKKAIDYILAKHANQ